MSIGAPSALRAWFTALLEENAAGITAERRGWNNYVADIYAAHARLHDQRRHDRRKQQWKNYERRGRKPAA